MNTAEVTLKIAELIAGSRHIVAFTGAGISTPSGIPDFRSPESGMWEQADPFTVASIFGFRHNPQEFYDWVRPLVKVTLEAKPNPAHLALSALEQRGKLASIITQNIDMLHTRAGNGCIYELHGHLREATCINCFTVYDAEPIMHRLLEDNSVPRCPGCGGTIKPNVILFGEQLPYRQLQGAKNEARKCDLMVVVGSSLEVAPASDLPVLAKRTDAKLVIINLQPTALDHMADVVVHDDAALVLPTIVEHLENSR